MTDSVALTAAVIGGGPAGLMAAEVLSAAGVPVTLYDRMPSLGRKFLMAGRGGLNLTHSEDFETFVARYGSAASRLRPMLEAFTPADLRAWAEGLGQQTFVGSSGRVFPQAMKASPLLRAWLARLAGQGVTIRPRSLWRGWDADGALLVEQDGRVEPSRPAATVLALGGASWPRLGSDGAWTGVLAGQGIEITPLGPANGGFAVAWSDLFADRFAGQPLKGVALTFGRTRIRAEAMITRQGLEGGGVYALSTAIRDAVAAQGSARLWFDLRPDMTADALERRLAEGRRGDTTTSRLRRINFSPLEINLLRESAGPALPGEPAALAKLIKGAAITLGAPFPIARAISTAGGVRFDAVDDGLMLRARPGVFVAGEMLDWEAPTGGYLLQACFATGAWAGRAALARIVAEPR